MIDIGKERALILDGYGRILVKDFAKGEIRSLEDQMDIKIVSGGAIDSEKIYVLLGDNTILEFDRESEKFIADGKFDQMRYIASSSQIKGFFCATS